MQGREIVNSFFAIGIASKANEESVLRRFVGGPFSWDDDG